MMSWWCLLCKGKEWWKSMKVDRISWNILQCTGSVWVQLALCKRAVTITIAVRGILRTEVQNTKDTSFPCNNYNSKIKLCNCILQRTITGQGMSHESLWKRFSFCTQRQFLHIDFYAVLVFAHYLLCCLLYKIEAM